MRYKIGFEFPFFNQKNLQHSHSHFAFAGWVSHTLMTLMVYYLESKIDNFNGQRYKKLIQNWFVMHIVKQRKDINKKAAKPFGFAAFV